jgi:methionine synthase / methylenetetrahydrofolate reductase(NADPH)
VPLGHCKPEQNLVNAGLVSDIHRDYVAAGAQAIETNTWGANQLRLAAFELEGKVREINLRGAELARKAADKAGKNILVAGAVGPLGGLLEPYGSLKPADVREMFAEQMAALAEGGVDMFCIETMSSVVETEEAVRAAKAAAKDLPVMALLTFTSEGVTKFGDEPEKSFRRLLAAGADVVGLNCTLGPKETFDIFRSVAGKFADVPLAVMPNAGYPQAVGGHIVYLTSPEYFREYAALYAEHGASVVGGCCGTAPEHIRAAASALTGRKPARAAKAEAAREAVISFPAAKKEAPRPSTFLEKLGKEFVQTVEITPPKGADCSMQIEAARMMRAVGIEAVDITDNPLARVRMSSLMLAHVLKQETGVEPIIHYTCRDKNVLAIQSDLIGGSVLGLRCILAITGDPLSIGDYPDAKAVFEVNSTGLVNIITTLNKGKDLAGNDIGAPTRWNIAVGINPLAQDWDCERKKIRDKIDGGARFAMTQPLYEPAAVETFVKRRKEYPELPVLVGVLPVRSYRNAKFLDEEVPYISVPKAILRRMEAAKEKGREAETEESLAIGVEIYRGMRNAGAQGIYFIPQMEKYEMVVEIVRRAEAA